MILTKRRQQIWTGEATVPSAVEYRIQWIRQFASIENIPPSEAYQRLCSLWGEPGSPVDLSRLADSVPQYIPEVVPVVDLCVHRGEVIHREPCTCKSDKKIDVYRCELHKRCVLTKSLLSKIRDKDTRRALTPCESCPDMNVTVKRNVPTIHKWIVGITTAPRKDPTLVQSVESLLAAGWDPVVFAEPGTDLSGLPKEARIVQRPNRLGCWHNWRQMCFDLLEMDPDAECILTVQDDTVFHRQSLEWIDRNLWPNDPVRTGFLSLYTPLHYSHKVKVFDEKGKLRYHGSSWWRAENDVSRANERLKLKGEVGKWTLRPAEQKPIGFCDVYTKALWGACALVFPRESLKKIIEHKVAKTWTGSARQIEVPDDFDFSSIPKEERKRYVRRCDVQNSDTAIGQIVHRLGLSMHWVIPSFATHVAEHSSIGHGSNTWKRNAPSFRANIDLFSVLGSCKSVSSHDVQKMRHIVCIRSSYNELSDEENRKRLSLTRRYCIPSLKHQTVKDFELVVCVHKDDLLLTERKALFESVGVPVRYVDGIQEIKNLDEPTIQTRMDDDDAIAIDFISRVQSSIHRVPNKQWYSFKYGVVLLSESERRLMHSVANAFLTRVCAPGESVYDVAHSQVLTPHIVDNRFGWMWVRHTSNMSSFRRSVNVLTKAQIASSDGLFRHLKSCRNFDKHVILVRAAYPDFVSSAVNRFQLDCAKQLLVESLRRQTNKNFELLVWVDPTDPMLELRKSVFEEVGVPVSFTEEFMPPFDRQVLQTRIDVDHGVSPDFVDRIQRAATSECIGNPYLYFPIGWIASWKDGIHRVKMSRNPILSRVCEPGQSIYSERYTDIAGVHIVSDHPMYVIATRQRLKDFGSVETSSLVADDEVREICNVSDLISRHQELDQFCSHVDRCRW